MKRKTILEEDRDLSPDKLRDHGLQPACEGSRHHARMHARVGGDDQHQHLLLHAPVAQRLALDPTPLLREMASPRNPEKQAGIFYEFPRLNPSALSLATESLRRRTVEQEKGSDPFHDSELDIYDLFNACDGVVLHDGRLDINKLDEYSPAEAEALNVTQLREIWKHAASCSECKRIIRTLNLIRGTLREDAEEPLGEQTEAVDINVSDSIS